MLPERKGADSHDRRVFDRNAYPRAPGRPIGRRGSRASQAAHSTAHPTTGEEVDTCARDAGDSKRDVSRWPGSSSNEPARCRHSVGCLGQLTPQWLPPMSSWLLIIADNTLHVLINARALAP